MPGRLMAKMGYYTLFPTMALMFATILSFNSGCKKKSGSSDPGAPATPVVLSPLQINRDGSINADGLKLLSSHSGDGNLEVNVVRAPMTDLGLAQLEKFPNIRHVTAMDGHLTDAAIAKLKRAIPEVEVER
jgi:hypothetical protein